jgi:hypothetical protein
MSLGAMALPQFSRYLGKHNHPGRMMASVPKIDSPCPIRWNAMPTADRNFCAQCECKVGNPDAVGATQRCEFLRINAIQGMAK